MKISIVIPTRNRSEFLRYCVATCLACEDDGIEVVVSDNNSADDTRPIIQAIDDPRLKYVCTGQDLSMRQNFEYALNHTKGDYVIYVGDDDGILPTGLAGLRRVIQQRQPDIALWRHITYLWPRQNPIPEPGRLKFRFRDFCGPMHDITPRKRLESLAQAHKTNYRDGANIYHGCVHRRVIDKVRSMQNGVYFNGVCPDVNTAITNLLAAKNILWFRNPVTIGGEGEKSNGTAFNGKAASSKQQQAIASDFKRLVAEDGTQPEIDSRIKSVPAQTYANLCLIKRDLDPTIPIDHTAWRGVVINDVNTYSPDQRYWPVVKTFFQTLDPGYDGQGLPNADEFEKDMIAARDLPAKKRKRKRHTDAQVQTVMTVVNWIEHVTGKPYTPSENATLAALVQAARIPGMWLRSLTAK